jgi:CheY-like chemotaxis protein
MAGTIMIIEDEADIRDSLRDLLELEGYRVTTAAHGREALDILGRGPLPDLILLDLLMPVMNGRDFRAAQRANPRFRSVPVLMMSADRNPETKMEDPSLQCIKKPLDLDELLSSIAHCLAQGHHASA